MTSPRLRRARRTAPLAAALLVALCAATVAAQTTAFTYQGRLTDGGAPANGSYDMQFALFNAESGGLQIGSTKLLTNVAVSGGSFTVRLNFGVSPYNGSDRFVEVAVRPAGGGAFTTLSPRQQITSAPYAIRALRATTALNSETADELTDTNLYIRNGTSAQDASFSVQGSGSVGGTFGVGGNMGVSGTLQLGGLPGGGSAPLCIASGDNPNIVRLCSSSLRYKSGVRPFSGGLDIVRRLRPITFDWKETGAHDLGLGAEEVAEVEPRLTFTNARGEVEGVKYGQLNVVLVNAVKQQQEQIERQQAQLERQQAEIERLTRLVLGRRQRHAARRAR